MKSMNRDDFLKKVCNYEANPEWKYLGEIPCVIDFHDNDCPPCKGIEPILKSLSEDYKEKIEFYKIDVSADEQLSAELGIQNLPTLVLCPVADKPIVLQGAATKEILIVRIESELLGN